MAKTSNRNGWTRLPGVHEIDTGKGKIYRGLVKFARPCASCAADFTIHVTEAVADGNSHNSSFGLRNCELHRMKMVAPSMAASSEELESLRSWKATVTEELKGFDQMRRDYNRLYEENSVLKARLAKYELAPAMEAVKPNGLGFRGATKNKLPWE